MLVFLLRTIYSLSVSVLGTTSNNGGNANGRYDIYLIEVSSINQYYNRIPRSMSLQCIYKTKYPDVYLVDDDPTSPIDIVVSPNLNGSLYLLNYFTKMNYSTVLSDKASAKYRISFSNLSKISYNLTIQYYVYSSRYREVICLYCHTKTLNPHKILFLLILTVFLVTVSLIHAHRIKIPLMIDSVAFAHQNSNIEEYQQFTKLEKKKIESIFNYARNGFEKNLSSSVIQMKRNKKSVSFKRCCSFKLSTNSEPFYLIYVWEERSKTSECNFNIKFESDDPYLQLKGTPKLRYRDFRDFCPYSLHYTFIDNSKATIYIPEEIITVYKPFGEIVVKFYMVMFGMSNTLLRNPISKDNLSNVVSVFCQILDGSHVLFFEENNKLFLCKESDNVKKFDENSFNEIKKHISGPDFHVKHKVPYENSIAFYYRTSTLFCSLTCVIVFDYFKETSPVVMIMISIMIKCCIVVYTLFKAHQQNLIFLHFSKLIKTLKSFIFTEFTSDFKHFIDCEPLTYNFNNSSINPNEFFSKFNIFYKELQKISKNKGSINQLVFQTNDQHWYTGYALYSDKCALNQSIITVILEDISQIKNKENELIETLSDFDFLMKEFGYYKFHIEDNKFILENDSLSKYLGYVTPILELNKIIYEQDLLIFDLLRNSQKVNIRLMSNDGKLILFSGTSNGHVGFLFCINDLMELHSPVKDNMEVFSSKFFIWEVDPKNESVHSVFNCPTIWDFLMTDKNMEFSKFVNYVHADYKKVFITNYSYLLKGIIYFWTDQIKIIKVGGEYRWYRLIMARTNTNWLFCLAIDVQKRKEKLKNALQIFKKQNEIFQIGKCMLWEFEDNKKQIDFKFEPGIENILKMNWTFVNKYIKPNQRNEFTKKMNQALRINSDFNMLVTLETNPSMNLLLQGKISGVSKVNGICFDLNELFKEKGLVKTRVEGMNMNYREIFQDVFECIDLLSLRSTTKSHQFYVHILNHISHLLFHNFTTPLYPYKQQRCDLNINFFEKIEPIFRPFKTYCLSKGIDFSLGVYGNFPDVINMNAYDLHILLSLVISKIINEMPKKIFISIQWHITYIQISIFSDKINQKDLKDFMLLFGGISNENETFKDKKNKKRINKKNNNISGSNFNINNKVTSQTSIHKTLARLKIRRPLTLTNKPVNSVLARTAMNLCNDSTQNKWFTFNINEKSLTVCISAEKKNSEKFELKDYNAYISVGDVTIKHQIIQELKKLKINIYEFNDIKQINFDALHKPLIFVEDENENFEIIKSQIEENNVTHILFIVSNDISKINSCPTLLLKPFVSAQVRRNILQLMQKGTISSDMFKPITHHEIIKRNVLLLFSGNCDMQTKVMKELGCNMITARNAEEAIKHLDNENFDLVFVDYWKSDLDGIAMAKIIRKSPKHYASIPIVAVCSNADMEKKCIEAGINAFYLKPFRLNQMKDALTRHYR